MHAPSASRLRVMLLSGAAALGLAIAPTAAGAAPYAFASNQIDNLVVTFAGPGGSIVPIPPANISLAEQSVQAGASFGNQQTPTLRNDGPIGTPLNLAPLPQAFAGPGPVPGDNIFSPAGPPGTFTGARADAFIGGGAAPAGVEVNNVAEGYGGNVPGTSGGSFARNEAQIEFTVTGGGLPLLVSFSNLIQLIASTDPNLGERAAASIANSFTITGTGGRVGFTATNLDLIDAEAVNASPNVPFDTIAPGAPIQVTILTDVLTAGQVYTVTLRSSASQDITVGTVTQIPEPASLALLGLGLLGLAAVRRGVAR